jgi:hypothetical protein
LGGHTHSTGSLQLTVSHDDTVEWNESRCVMPLSPQRLPKSRAVRNAEDCLSSEGGHRRLCAATPAPAFGVRPKVQYGAFRQDNLVVYLGNTSLR